MKCYCSQHSPKEDNKCSKTLSFSDYNSNIMFKDNRISHKMQKANINSICQRTTAIDPLCTQFKENHIIEKSKTPNIWEFTACAIDKGAPNTLNYIPNKESVVYVRNMINEEIVTKVQADKEKIPYSPISIHEVNRVKVLSRDDNQLFKDVKYAPGRSRDEYPYASTIEGGSDGYWAYVPVHEQSVQGGKLQGLYKRLLSSGSSEFDVVLA